MRPFMGWGRPTRDPWSVSMNASYCHFRFSCAEQMGGSGVGVGANETALWAMTM